MAVKNQVVAGNYALYNGDCIDVMKVMKDCSIHMSLYSPPFGGLYNYSSSQRDLSNSRSYEEFFKHYSFVVSELYRLTIPGRISAVHCSDIRCNGANLGGGLVDFSGDVIRLHKRLGFDFAARYHIWKEPLGVRNRTMAKSLAHCQTVEDSTLCDCASADYMLMFRKKGENPIPVTHPQGFQEYAGERKIPNELLRFRKWKGKQTENRYSHWIWRQYASAFWDDIRIGRVLSYKQSRDPEDERHVHPLQLDAIERCCVLWTNPEEVILSPFMGVGSEVFGAVVNNRKGVGIELKPSYYKQAVKNLRRIKQQKGRRTFDL